MISDALLSVAAGHCASNDLWPSVERNGVVQMACEYAGRVARLYFPQLQRQDVYYLQYMLSFMLTKHRRWDYVSMRCFMAGSAG